MKDGIIKIGFVCLLIFLYGADCKEKKQIYKPKRMEFKYLPIYRSNIDLPGTFLYPSGEYSSLCMEYSGKRDTVDAANEVSEEYLDEAEIEKGVKLALRIAIEKAGQGATNMDIKSISKTIEKWHVKIYGMDYLSIDPAGVKANFTIGTCRTPELNWFINGREIVVGAVKADSISLTTEKNLSNAVRTALNLVFDENTGVASGNLGLDFKKAELNEGVVRIVANNVFFATRSTSLYAKECKYSFSNIKPENWYDACGYKFWFTKVDSNSYHYILRIESQIGSTCEFLEKFDMRVMRIIDNVHYIGLLLSKTSSEKYKGEISTWLVGPDAGSTGGER